MASDDDVKISLAEFETLRMEINTRLQSQSQTFAYVMAVLGGLISILVAISNTKDAFNGTPVGLVALCVPLLWAPIAMIFFDNEMMIFSIGAHLSEHVLPQLRLGEPGAFRSGAAEVQSRIVALTHFVASIARWVLLVVPVAAVVIGGQTFHGSRWLKLVLLGVDAILLAALLMATTVVIYMQMQWRWPDRWPRWTRQPSPEDPMSPRVE